MTKGMKESLAEKTRMSELERTVARERLLRERKRLKRRNMIILLVALGISLIILGFFLEIF